MVLYRARGRRRGLLVVAAVAVVVALAAAYVLLARRTTGGADRDAEAQEAVRRIAEGLDVLALSHYTDQVVRDGQVVDAAEYAAARRNVAAIRKEFEGVEGRLAARDPGATAEAGELLAHIAEAVERKAPPAEVRKLADAATAAVLRAAGGGGS
ncbi:MAG: hypothetical protein IRY95_06165 [Clostridia bacterium]|nr:hypothetical protein [Clostridia bacterium]